MSQGGGGWRNGVAIEGGLVGTGREDQHSRGYKCICSLYDAIIQRERVNESLHPFVCRQSEA